MSLREPHINGTQEKPYFCSHDHRDVLVDAYVTIINLIILRVIPFIKDTPLLRNILRILPLRHYCLAHSSLGRN